MATSCLRRSPFVPQLDVLEGRWCPAITMTRFGDALVIVGDAASDVITIQYNGSNGFTAVDANGNGSFNDAVDGRFNGISQLMVNLGLGNDNLQFNLLGALSRTVDVQIDLGEGANTLGLNLGSGISAPAGQAAFNVLAGTGSDTVRVTLGGIGGGLTVNMGLGDGDNLVDIQANNFISAATTFRIETGKGLDVVNGSFGGPIDCSSNGQIFNFSAKLGDGNDRIALGFQDILTSTNLNLDTGNHQDRVSLAFRNVLCGTSQANTRLQVNLDLGAGNDKFDGEINGLISDRDNAAAASFVVQAGKGDDTLTFDAFTDLGRPQRGGALHLNFKGDRGDDVMAVAYAGKQATVTSTAQGGALTREPSLNVTLNGGAGNDTIGLIVDRTDSSGSPKIRAKIYGDAGADVMAFNFKGKGKTRGTQVIDGGTGTDQASAQGGVKVQNV